MVRNPSAPLNCIKLPYPQVHSNTKLQIAAVVCILNLIWRNDEGSADRQSRLKEIGWGGVYSFPSWLNILKHANRRVFKILHQLLTTSDSNLFEKVKLALQQLTMWQVYRLLIYAQTLLRVWNSQVIEEAADHEETEDGEAVLTPGDKIDFLFFWTLGTPYPVGCSHVAYHIYIYVKGLSQNI